MLCTKYLSDNDEIAERLIRAYVQFRGSEFHTSNARSRQLQEQRRAKAQR